MLASRRNQAIWGYLGAAAAAWFAIWMLFFPDQVADYFAWNVHPRYAQAFIGAGYVFRTFFFLNAAREGNWFRLRWIVWGNLVFTGTLLLATYWHLTEFHWPPAQTPLAHIWIILYIFEPVAMVYLIPRGILFKEAPVSGGQILTVFRTFLVLITGLLLMQGLFLVAQPEFANTRWAWELNPLDARIIAAWFLGWSIWCGTMAFATDWDEIRTATGLFVLNGAALLVTAVVFRNELLNRGTTIGYVAALVIMTGAMILFFYIQERRRPAALQPAVASAA